jgi:hypothetical protein
VKFCADLLSSSANQEQIDAKYRYFRTLVRDSREGDFLTMFGDPFKGPDQTIPVPRPGTF